jgi:hypothetical protein
MPECFAVRRLTAVTQGYSLRWATYSRGGFKEGVSLTCDDELNRYVTLLATEDPC